VQISVSKFYIYLFFLIILSSCGIVKKDIDEQNTKAKIIFKKPEPIKQELNQNLKINLTQLIKGEPFLRNNSNNIGNIDFNTSFNKTSSYKFSNIKNFIFNQPELLFTNNKNIIFFDGKGSIFKIDKNLKELWKVNHYKKKEKKLNPIMYFAQTDNNLVIADNLSKIYLINLINGDLIWSIENNIGFNSNIKIFNDRFMVVDLNNTIRCFSIKDGKELWNYSSENPFIKSKKKLSLVIKGEIVFFINNIGDVTALNIINGSLFWQTPTQSNTIYNDAFTLENSDLVFSNNSIYFSNNKNEFFSLDAQSGIVRWKQTINSSLTPVIIENFVFSVSKEGYLFVIDDQKGDVIRINYILKNIKNKKNQIEPSGFIIARNKIYLSLNNGRLIKTDVATGSNVNIFKLGNSKISRPNIFDSKMYLLKDNAIIRAN